ncbi:ImmA/IrrE family metallo-endopeptidase [Paenibacillus sp. FSL R5-0810]|uniref:ImmA/IrrE family metallo-endopeptidase n=1 Tax=Paenibacillus sp. FSL R5-0810 TaxID=2921659 RepID=UPI0030F670CB
MDKVIAGLLKKYKTNCPFLIAKYRGVKITYADLGESTWGVYYSKFRQRYIVIHNKLCEDWQRLICAHELGHDVLHSGINRFFIDDRTFYISAKHERQANIFAVHLLTALETIQDGESITDFFSRNNIPPEMVLYYKGVI